MIELTVTVNGPKLREIGNGLIGNGLAYASGNMSTTKTNRQKRVRFNDPQREK
ncbi:MAG: hypothetical protein WCC94_11710 [Candidatus Bathyarchaeia archaeon]